MDEFFRIALIAGLSACLLGFAVQGATASDKAAGNPQVKKDTAASVKTEKQIPAKTILFFMNPNGQPCRMQNAIIEDMKDSLKGLAQVAYVKTTEPADRDKFETWAIRGLPSLIIVDKNSKESNG